MPEQHDYKKPGDETSLENFRKEVFSGDMIDLERLYDFSLQTESVNKQEGKLILEKRVEFYLGDFPERLSSIQNDDGVQRVLTELNALDKIASRLAFDKKTQDGIQEARQTVYQKFPQAAEIDIQLAAAE